ncbi:MAG TPA: HAMP domain-containing sensor histidine kinase [Thermomicrobiales bacterium]|nr:HAMP domain-containing sensor histidine kinase [Thermomicrobiales bacterium]
MRNRLTVVKGYSQLLERITQRREIDQTRVTAYCTALTQEIALFETLLEQYFAAARLQWDDAAINWHAVDLGRLTQQVVTRFDASSPPRGRRHLHVETRDDIQGVWDHHWLGEAVAALVSNALTYSPDGSEVRLIVRRQNDHALLVVTDAGSGVVPGEEEQIFEPFERGVAAREAGARGWGLGLFIASQAVVAHGGWLEIESEPGWGSQFSVHMPLLPPTAQPLPA